MVLDTSALTAILQKEPEHDRFVAAVAADAVRLVSAVSVVEAGIVLEARHGAAGAAHLDHLLLTIRAEVMPFDSRQADLARRAWRSFGKGNHPAGLNFGDCCAYALARVTGEPLLFKGSDFAQTDITPAG